MPGENCCIVGCGTNRRTKGVGIFKLPSSKLYKEWRSRWLNEITKYRVLDKSFKAQIDNDRVYTCERHFPPEDIEIFEGNPKSRKKPRLGAIPTLNMPGKSHQSKQTPARTARNIVNTAFIPQQQRYNYECLHQVKQSISKLKSITQWTVEMLKDQICLKKLQPPWTVPHITVLIDDGLGYTVRVFDWLLPEDHWLYKKNRRNLRNITIANLIKTLEALNLCQGTCSSERGGIIYHAVPRNTENNSSDDESQSITPFKSDVFHRVKNCELLINNDEKQINNIDTCEYCISYKKLTQQEKNRKEIKAKTPAKLYAPISKTNPQRVVLTLRAERLKCSLLQHELQKMKIELQKTTVTIDHALNNDFLSILSDSDHNITPFMNLFWQQQKRLFKCNPKGMRYHPMIIRYCLSLASKSKSAYEELRNSNILKLPSARTLRDYKNVIRPKAGFRRQVIDDLIEQTNDYFDVERYIALLFDEMRIRSNLVFNKHTEELIGFVDLGDPEINFNSFDNQTDLATHTLVFYLRGLCTNLKYSLAHFATDGITATQLLPIFWEAVSILEITCNLWIISTTADGASANRRFYKLIGGNEGNEKGIVHKTRNIIAPWRYIYLFADGPHLLKTARNCLASSGSGTYSRYMWNENQNLLWQHIAQMYYDDLDNGLKLLPKISQDHINLTSYSKMTVKYAVQILSKTVSIVLQKFGSPEVKQTATFCEIMDSFFDCMNVRSTEEAGRKRKPFLQPYASVNDSRFDWLRETFLPYFSKWKENIMNRSGDFTKTARAKMFISQQTYEGLQISSHSLIECIQFLIKEGMEYVLSERFCQDPVEEYFGAQRKQGRRSDNPDFNQCLYNDNTIRIQREVSVSTGNTRGRYDHKRSWENITNDPIQKRQKKISNIEENLNKVNFNF